MNFHQVKAALNYALGLIFVPALNADYLNVKLYILNLICQIAFYFVNKVDKMRVYI